MNGADGNKLRKITVGLLFINYKKMITYIHWFKTWRFTCLLETGFCLCLQVEPIQLGPVDRASQSLDTSNTKKVCKANTTSTMIVIYPIGIVAGVQKEIERLDQSIGPNLVGSTWRQTKFGLQNVMF
jgi:hypothetical protein